MAEGKSGYELRESLLHLAHRIVEHNAQMRYDASKTVTVVEGVGPVERREWQGFTPEEVIKVAGQLYEFVQRK